MADVVAPPRPDWCNEEENFKSERPSDRKRGRDTQNDVIALLLSTDLKIEFYFPSMHTLWVASLVPPSSALHSEKRYSNSANTS